jgi:uncharacterized membrane protein YfcA
MTPLEITIAVGGSFLAGAINTLAGNGSVITLNIMTDMMGMPAHLANATNRVGILLQSAASYKGFSHHHEFAMQKANPIMWVTLAGSVCGALTAIWISPEAFQFVFRYLLLLMLFLIIGHPERWIREGAKKPMQAAIRIPLFFVLGFYGGFIQMGMGIFFLAVLVLYSGYSMMEANVIKTRVIMLYTLVVLGIFTWNDMIDWASGLLIASGQVAGGYVTARYATKLPGINQYAYYVLVLMVLTSVFIQFKIIDL